VDTSLPFLISFYEHISIYCACLPDEVEKLADKHLKEVCTLISSWLIHRIGHDCNWELSDDSYPDSCVLKFSKWHELMGLLSMVENM